MKAFGGAFLATSSAAFSTIIYLYLSHGQPWASRFIQLYSLVGMVSGWINTAVMQIAPRYPGLQRKTAGLIFWVAACLATVGLYLLLFGKTLSWLGAAATASLLAPILYAAVYSGAFAVGAHGWVYKRATLFNVLLLMGGLVAIPLGRSYESLCMGIALAAIGIIPCYLFDRRDPGTRKDSRTDIPAAILNPSLPTLERSVWDQWVLHRLSLEPIGWGLYLLTRMVTFAGNVFFSFLMGVQAHEESAHSFTPKMSLWLLGLNALLLAATALAGSYLAYLLFGNLVAWQVSLLLAAYYQNRERSHYYIIGASWLLTLVLRLGLLHNWPDIYYYSVGQAIASWAVISGLYLYLLNRPRAPNKSK